MRNFLILTIIATIAISSCGQENKSSNDRITTEIGTLESLETNEEQRSQDENHRKFLDDEYRYNDTNGKRITIQNSLPKGGLEYNGPNGEKYVYAVFWTRIINETNNPFELSIEIPSSGFAHGLTFDNYFKVFVSKKEMNIDKLSLLNYGLGSLNDILDNNLQKPSSLQKTIMPNNTDSFYVITLFNKGLGGTVRAGLNVKDGKLFYKLNNTVIPAGQVNIKNLQLENK
ncbi:hypothetical protein [Maribacter sp. 2304DJ31-5]|uniref:hypothetical protein n=1 Tax=Maribacter sp. 2304DJ31-5 TaxID=3386273 RepID=UPI0039BCF926